MLEQVHQHLTSELQQSARTDTVFVITAVVFNLLVLGIDSMVAEAAIEESSVTSDLVLAILTALVILVNAMATIGLLIGRRTRVSLIRGLLSMYRDNQVDKYYDPSLLTNYGRRYTVFTAVIAWLPRWSESSQYSVPASRIATRCAGVVGLADRRALLVVRPHVDRGRPHRLLDPRPVRPVHEAGHRSPAHPVAT